MFLGRVDQVPEEIVNQTQNQVLSAFKFQAQETIQLWYCASICGALASIIGVIFFDYAVIYSSCFTGSYLIIRGFSMVIGGFPNEFMVYDSIINAKLGDQGAVLFAYIFAIILLTVFTIQRQLRLR